jgi:chemotaxis protein methyltransferase CheR
VTDSPFEGDGSVLSPADLARFSDFLYRRTGMLFGESKRYYIDRRIADRMAALRTVSFSDYFAILRSAPEELETLINAFTVNETYFYREERHFACLSDNLLPAIAANKGPGDRIRIWALPCSTGEEAYSIAIWLLEHWALVDAYHVEIVGSDIDTRALAEAVEGIYGARALGRLPPDLIERYFKPERGGVRHIIEDLRESVIFAPANLIDAATLAPHGAFDVILCRNVLIYFDDSARATAIRNLHDRLLPGGFLILGHTESMAKVHDDFRTRRFGDVAVFQRVERRR